MTRQAATWTVAAVGITVAVMAASGEPASSDQIGGQTVCAVLR